MVHVPACVVEQAGRYPISIAPVLIGLFDDVIARTLLIGPALRQLALRRSMLTDCAARAALRYTKLPPHMVDAVAAT